MSDRRPLGDTDWYPVLQQEFGKPYWAKLHAFLEAERGAQISVRPGREDIYAAFELTSYAETKMVILGQDPYSGPDQAHGLCFSVPIGKPKPPSLKNIHDELHADLGVPIPKHGSLELWARRGVLLLNAVLTVREGVRQSHRGKGWETFTNTVIKALSNKVERVVFVLWGEDAKGKKNLIDTSRHTVIESSHPSPLSANKNPVPFLGSKPFSRANLALVEADRSPIDWTL